MGTASEVFGSRGEGVRTRRKEILRYAQNDNYTKKL
jgi:hypothetical protein